VSASIAFLLSWGFSLSALCVHVWTKELICDFWEVLIEIASVVDDGRSAPSCALAAGVKARSAAAQRSVRKNDLMFDGVTVRSRSCWGNVDCIFVWA